MSKLNKIIYSILFIIIILFITFIVSNNLKEKTYLKEYKYFDSIIIISIDTNKNINRIFADIDNIYIKYEKNNNLTDNKEEYLNKKIEAYFKEKKIDKYTINMNNIILVSNDTVKIGLPDPDDELNILKVIEVKNSCVATISPFNVGFKNEEFKSISVVSKDNCETMAKKIYNMSLNDGQKLVNNNDDIEAIWYTKNNEFVKSNNFKKYE